MASDNSSMKVKQPIDIEWKIAENELQKLQSSIDGFLESFILYIPDSGIRYYIKICPNGNKEKNRGNTWIFLRLRFEEQKEIEAEFTITVESANFSKKIKFVYTKTYGWGCSPCTVDQLFDPETRFIVDGEMTIKVDGFLMIEKNVPNQLCKLGGYGNQICIGLWHQDSKDFTIVVDGKEIQVHKGVLSIRSPVFEAMFKPHTQEAQESKVMIPDFTFSVVEAAMKFCYDSSLVEKVSLEDQMSLLQFFDKYDIKELKDNLEKNLCSQIFDSTACRLAKCSILSNAPELKKKCGDYLQKCFRENKLIIDFDILDKDFAFELLRNSLNTLPV